MILLSVIDSYCHFVNMAFSVITYAIHLIALCSWSLGCCYLQEL